MIPLAARPKPGRGRLAPTGTGAPCSPVDIGEDGAVVPSQLARVIAPLAIASLPHENVIHTRDVHASSRQFRGWPSILRPRAVDKPTPRQPCSRGKNHRQLGSQICMFHVDCEIGMPVRIGYIHAKFVITRAT